MIRGGRRENRPGPHTLPTGTLRTTPTRCTAVSTGRLDLRQATHLSSAAEAIMTLRTVSRSDSASIPDSALDEALDHIGALAERLWAVRRLHVPQRGPGRFATRRVRCAGCGQALPCPTLRATRPG